MSNILLVLLSLLSLLLSPLPSLVHDLFSCCFFSLQGVHEHALYSLQVSISVHVVGLQIACLSPLVPAVDGDERYLMGMLVGIVAGMYEGLSEVLRRIVACHGTLVGAWAVVPPYAHMWVIWDGEGCVQSSPFLHGSFGYLLVVLVHP